MSVTDDEYTLIQSAMPNANIYVAAVVKLYQASPDYSQWSYTGIVGPAVVVEDGGFSYIRIFDLKTNSVVFEQEFYAGFDYVPAQSFFHTVESNDTVFGFSFADEGEADQFAGEVAKGKEYIPVEEEEAPAPAPVTPKGLPPKPTGAPPKPTGGPPPKPGGAPPKPSGPPPQRAPLPSAPPPTPSAPPPSAPSTPAPSAPTSSPAPISHGAAASQLGEATQIVGLNMKVIPIKNAIIGKEEPKKADKKGLFGGMFAKKEPKKPQVSAPTDFKHDSHIGWDPVNGFEIHNIPPEWKKLFQAAGVKKSDLKDVETSKFLVNTVAEALTAPPPPPPPPPGGLPPPPPKAAPKAAPAAPALSLSDQLAAKQLNLKKVDPNEPPSVLPSIKNLDEATNDNLVQTLAFAMQARRGAVGVESDSDEPNDDWSD